MGKKMLLPVQPSNCSPNNPAHAFVLFSKQLPQSKKAVNPENDVVLGGRRQKNISRGTSHPVVARRAARASWLLPRLEPPLPSHLSLSPRMSRPLCLL